MNNHDYANAGAAGADGDYTMEDAAIVSGSDIYDHEDDSDSSTCYSNNNDTNHHNNNNNMEQIEEEDVDADSEHNNIDIDNEIGTKHSRKYKKPNADPLYNPNGDDEDEAYVYRHLRGGLEEHVSIRSAVTGAGAGTETGVGSTSTSLGNETNNGGSSSTTTMHTNTNDTNQNQKDADVQNQKNINSKEASTSTSTSTSPSTTKSTTKILKPRNSDGILSCPCCFQIVCMDCQKHEKYSNQYRAMFVMNIGVSWDVTLSPEFVGKDTDTDTDAVNNNTNNNNDAFSHQQHQAKKIKGNSNPSKLIIPTDDKHNNEDIYYSVYCNNCRTQVAALDMTDEVYHFFGCIVSG